MQYVRVEIERRAPHQSCSQAPSCHTREVHAVTRHEEAVRGIATSSSIFSIHGSTPPKSERRTVGGAYSFDVLPVPVPVRLRLLPSSPRVDRSLHLLCELVEGGTGVCSTAPKAEELVRDAEVHPRVLMLMSVGEM
jgi:hypothetical protein